MTNLKKTLAVVLAFAMILSMGAISTFAYTDVEAGTVVSEAVDILSNLDIFTGFEDGTFRPDETVTRAQMAAIICRTLGYDDQAKSSMGSTIFNDVAADHWASGYVNVAQAQGIINGYGDGNFGPEDKVTYEQAVKMIVSALGYDLAAQTKGGYPTGYLAIASAEGITKSANGKVGDAATRGTIAVLVYNSLEVRLMDQNSWTTNNQDEYKKTDDTILSKYLEVTKWEGIVTNTPLTYTAQKGTYDADATPKMAIFGKYFYYNEGKLIDRAYDSDGDGYTDNKVVECDKVDTADLLGKSVVAYIGEDDYTGNDTVYAIALNESKNEVTKISAQQLVESGQKYWNETGVVGYTNAGSSKIQDLTITGAQVYVNYKAAAATKTSELASLLSRGGIIEFVSNDADTDIEYIIATSYEREAVVEAVKENNSIYTFDCYKGKLPKIDAEDDEALVAVYKDGAAATVADIAANDTGSYVEVADGLELLFVSSATVTGVVDSYDANDNIVTIAGVDYEISKVSGLSVQKLSGEEGTFFLNVDGQIAHNETAPTSVGKYALALAVYDEATGLESGSYIQVALADGTIAEYQISKTAKVVSDDNTAINTDGTVSAPSDGKTPIATDANFKAYFAAKMTQQTPATTYKTTVSDINSDADLLVKLTVSNNKVTKARLLPAGSSALATSGAKYDAEAVSLGSLDFDDSTVVFSVKETAGVIDPDNIKVATVADIFADEETYTQTIRAYDEDDNTSVYGALVGCGISKPIAVDSDVFVVASKKTTTYDDNDAYVLTGMIAGEEKTITVYNKDGYGVQDPASLAAGDVILISEPNAEGIVSDIEKLVDYNKALSTVVKVSGAVALDEIYSGFGALTSASSNKFVINAAITPDESPAVNSNFAGASAGISYRSSANYTLVDYSENSKNPEVTFEDGSEYTFDADYVSYVYVRVVDGRLADVVIYRHGEKAAASITANVAEGDVLVSTTATFDVEAVTGATVSVTASNANATVDANGVVTFAAAPVSDGAVTITVSVGKSGYETVSETFDYTVKASLS